jgi:hypothetical protein
MWPICYGMSIINTEYRKMKLVHSDLILLQTECDSINCTSLSRLILCAEITNLYPLYSAGSV